MSSDNIREFMILSEDIKFDNIMAAQRLFQMLNDEGFKVVPKEDPRPSAMDMFAKQYIDDQDQLEMLSEKEHRGWLEARKMAGWNKGSRNDYFKTHPCFMNYNDLEPADKEKDRSTIRIIPEFFEHSRFKIIISPNNG